MMYTRPFIVLCVCKELFGNLPKWVWDLGTVGAWYMTDIQISTLNSLNVAGNAFTFVLNYSVSLNKTAWKFNNIIWWKVRFYQPELLHCIVCTSRALESHGCLQDVTFTESFRDVDSKWFVAHSIVDSWHVSKRVVRYVFFSPPCDHEPVSIT